MRFMVSALLTLFIASCGGGGDDASAPTPAPPIQAPPVSAGRYVVTNEVGASLLTTPQELVYISPTHLGFGTWSMSGSEATSTITLLTRPVDDLGNASPGADLSGSTKTITRGVLSLSSGTAPDVASLPRNWEFTNLYRFGTAFINYTAQIDIDSAGTLSGFDTNGCTFSGEITPRTDGVPMYTAHVFALNCGATLTFIENAEHHGHAYLDGNSLVIVAVNRLQQGGLGLALTLFPR